MENVNGNKNALLYTVTIPEGYTIDFFAKGEWSMWRMADKHYLFTGDIRFNDSIPDEVCCVVQFPKLTA